MLHKQHQHQQQQQQYTIRTRQTGLSFVVVVVVLRVGAFFRALHIGYRRMSASVPYIVPTD